jgi:dTMP kinase
MIKRLKSRKSLNRYDKFNYNFYDKVQKGFIKMSKNNKKKYQLINSNLDIFFNEQVIIKKIKKLIK